jgi:hypothetical protein
MEGGAFVFRMRGSFPKLREEGKRVYSLSKKFHVFMGKEPRYPELDAEPSGLPLPTLSPY